MKSKRYSSGEKPRTGDIVVYDPDRSTEIVGLEEIVIAVVENSNECVELTTEVLFGPKKGLRVEHGLAYEYLLIEASSEE